MKKIAIILVAATISCMALVNAQGGNLEKQFVAKFLSYMHAERGTNYPGLMSCISPNYLKENNIDKEKYKVNNYTIWGFTIDSFDETENIVYTKVYGQKRSWTYKLTFKLSKENGKFYIIPSSSDTEWIHPWWGEVETIK